MFLLQFGLGLNCLEVCKQKEETAKFPHLLSVSFLFFFFEVLKYCGSFYCGSV